MATIDYRYYPHIFKNIWGSLDYPGLVVFRQVNKAFRRATTPFLMRQVSFGRLQDDSFEIRALNIDYPHLRPLLYWESGVDPEDTEVIEVDKTYGPLQWINRVKRIDIIGYHRFFEIDAELLSDTIQNATTLRWLDSTLSPICTPYDQINVFFFQLKASHPALGISMRGHPLTDRGSGSWSSRKVVLSYDCFVDPTTLPQNNFGMLKMLGLNGDTKYVTVILNDKRAQSSGTTGAKLPGSDIGFIFAFLHMIRQRLADPHARVVGLECFISDARIREQFLEKISERFMEENAGVAEVCDMRPDWFKNHWHIWTHAEYKRRVGEANYKLHAFK